MTTFAMMAGVAITSLIAGILSGAFYWHKCFCSRTPAAKSTMPPGMLIWDIHSLLNTMSRFAVAAERGNSIDPALVYNLSDYLLHSSMLQRENGWADAHTLENWLLAHLRIVMEFRPRGGIPAVRVKVGENVRRVQAGESIQQLLWFLQKAHSIESIEVRMTSQPNEPKATVSIDVYGTLEELRRLPMEDLPSIWELNPGRCSCELRASVELRSPDSLAKAA